MNAPSSFNLGVSFSNFLAYLTTKDKLELSRTSKLIRHITLKGVNWQTFEISDFEVKAPLWQNYLTWVQKYIEIIQPLQLNLLILKQDHEEDKHLLKILMQPRQSIQQLTIRTNSNLFHLALASSCPNLSRIAFQSSCITDQLAQCMFKYLKKVTQIEINVESSGFTCTKISQYLTNRLQKLILKPYNLEYQQLIFFINNEELNELYELEIDVQNCEEEQLFEIISNLKHINRLRLYHMQKFEAFQFPKLLASKLGSQMKELTLTKYRNNLTPVIQKVASPYLQYLDVTEGCKLVDQSVLLLSNCCNLKRINLSWCNEVTNKSLLGLISNCKALQRLTLTGIKSISDEIFDEYIKFKPDFNQKKYDQLKYAFRSQCKHSKQSLIYLIDEKYKELSKLDALFKPKDQLHLRKSTLTNLRYLECQSCNHISDTILKIIYCFNRMAEVINYYGEDLSLHRNSFEQQFLN